MTVILHRQFEKQYQKLRPREQARVKQRLQLFSIDPYHITLHNHPLKGRYLDLRSIDITGDLRAIFKQISDYECIFVDVDTHNNLYGH